MLKAYLAVHHHTGAAGHIVRGIRAHRFALLRRQRLEVPLHCFLELGCAFSSIHAAAVDWLAGLGRRPLPRCRSGAVPLGCGASRCRRSRSFRRWAADVAGTQRRARWAERWGCCAHRPGGFGGEPDNVRRGRASRHAPQRHWPSIGRSMRMSLARPSCRAPRPPRSLFVCSLHRTSEDARQGEGCSCVGPRPSGMGRESSTSLAASLCCSPWHACRGDLRPWQGRAARSAGRHAPCLAASLPRLLERRVCSGTAQQPTSTRVAVASSSRAAVAVEAPCARLLDECSLNHATVLTPASTLWYHSWFHPQWRKKRMRRLKRKRRRQRAK